MQLPSPDSKFLPATLAPMLTDLLHGYQQAGDGEDGIAPPPLAHAFLQGVEAFSRAGRDGSSKPVERKEISPLGMYGLRLVNDSGVWLDRTRRGRRWPDLAALAVAICLWLSRQRGALTTHGPLVDGLAAPANGTAEPGAWETPANEAGEFAQTAGSRDPSGSGKGQPGRPRRLLPNLNRGIMVRHSRNPDLTARSFDAALENPPEEAPAFFDQGMKQMDAVGYPSAMREVMARYHERWSGRGAVH